MTTAISNADLLNKCREFIVEDPASEALNINIKNALITASREIFDITRYQPLAWSRQAYDELFTRAYASISDITGASPGVITAESNDADINDDTGYQTNDIVFIQGIYGMDQLNSRYFLITRVSATTVTLTQLDGQNAIDTSDYNDYVSGGYVYHAGMILPATTIQPSSEDYQWKIKRIWKCMFEGNPAYPISDEEAKSDLEWNTPGGRPSHWNYWRSSFDNPTTYSHFIRWYPPTNNRFNVQINIEKAFPDLTKWTTKFYPPHPPEVHDFIWHRALANLVGLAERQKRQGVDGRNVMGQIEILNARYWLAQKIADEAVIKKLSKTMLGEMPSLKGLSA